MLTSVNTRNTAFLNQVSICEWLYVIRKEAQPKSQLSCHLTEAFDKRARWAYGVVFISFALIWYLLLKLQRKSSISFSKLLLLTIGMQSAGSVNIRTNMSTSVRILLSSLLIFSLIMCNAYQGKIVSGLTNPKKLPDIDKLENLLDNGFNFTVFTLMPDFFKPNADFSNINKMQKRLYERQSLETNLNVENLKKVLGQPKHAALRKIFKNLKFF